MKAVRSPGNPQAVLRQSCTTPTPPTPAYLMICNRSSKCHKRINEAIRGYHYETELSPKEAYLFVNVFDEKHGYLLASNT